MDMATIRSLHQQHSLGVEPASSDSEMSLSREPIVPGSEDCFTRATPSRDAAAPIYKHASHIQVAFLDVFEEPWALRSSDVGRVLSPLFNKLFHFVYSYTQGAIYYFLTILVGLPLCLAWGTLFAVVNLVLVWIVHPTITCVFMVLRVIAMVTNAALRSVIDPVFASVGLVFSSFRAQIQMQQVSVSGLADDNRHSGVRGNVSGRHKRRVKSSGSYSPEWLGFV